MVHNVLFARAIRYDYSKESSVCNLEQRHATKEEEERKKERRKERKKERKKEKKNRTKTRLVQKSTHHRLLRRITLSPELCRVKGLML